MGRVKEMLTTGDVARALGVTINTVKAWVRAGKVGAVRLPSGHYRIPRRELTRLLSHPPPAGPADRWDVYGAWQRAQPARAMAPGPALEWASAMLRVAQAGAPIPQPSLNEKARRVARLHRALAAAGR